MTDSEYQAFRNEVSSLLPELLSATFSKRQITKKDCRKMYKYMVKLKRYVFDRLGFKEKLIFKIVKAM